MWDVSPFWHVLSSDKSIFWLLKLLATSDDSLPWDTGCQPLSSAGSWDNSILKTLYCRLKIIDYRDRSSSNPLSQRAAMRVTLCEAFSYLTESWGKHFWADAGVTWTISSASLKDRCEIHDKRAKDVFLHASKCNIFLLSDYFQMVLDRFHLEF